MGGIIKVFIQGLIGSLAISLPELIRRLAISIGIGTVTFVGLDTLLNHLKDMAFSSVSGMPSITANVIGLLQIDTAFGIVMSAYAIKLSFKTLGGLNPKQLRLL